ncbi:MAG: hypothetical protein ACRDYC_12580 [Acidimicrobiales bacterium]
MATCQVPPSSTAVARAPLTATFAGNTSVLGSTSAGSALFHP